MDFNASPVGVFVTTKLVYVATLPLAYVSSSSVMALLWLCRNISDFNPFESMLRHI